MPIADKRNDGFVRRIPFEKGKKKALSWEAQHWWPPLAEVLRLLRIHDWEGVVGSAMTAIIYFLGNRMTKFLLLSLGLTALTAMAGEGPPTFDVNVANTPLPVTGSVEVESPIVFQIAHFVLFQGGAFPEDVSEFLAEDALLLTVDIKISNVVVPAQGTCTTITMQNGTAFISREFFDRNPGPTGARSDQAVNLSLAPGVRFNAGDEITSRVGSDGTFCTGTFRYFFRAL